MKKRLLLVVLIMLLSGCKVEYNLSITDNNFSEKTNVYVLADQDLDEIHPEVSMSYETIFNNINKKNIYSYFDESNINPSDESTNYNNVKYYYKESIRANNKYGESIYTDFTENDYFRSNIVKNCYNEFNLAKNDSVYTLKTNNVCKAFDNYKLLEELTINITLNTSYTLIYSNADEVNNNVYTWNIDSNNYKNKSISFIYDTEKRDLSKFESVQDKKEEEKNNWIKEHTALIIVCTFGILGIIIGIIIFLKSKTI